MYLSDAIWHCQKEDIPEVVHSDFDIETGIPFAGLYTDGVDSFDCSMYSSPDGYNVGSYTAVIAGVEYSGEMQFDETFDSYVCFTDALNPVTIFFNTAGDVPTVSLIIQTLDGTEIETPEYPMTQHYES